MKPGDHWRGQAWQSGASCFATCVAPTDASLPIHSLERVPAHHGPVQERDGGGAKRALHATDSLRVLIFWMHGRLRQSSQIGRGLHCTLNRVATVNCLACAGGVQGNESKCDACCVRGLMERQRLAAGNVFGARPGATAATQRFKSLACPYYDQAIATEAQP